MKTPKPTRPPLKSPATKENEMALHALWSGTISFSLVAIPVQLVKAIEPGRVSFRLLHGKDFSPLERKMFCPREEKIVSPEEIVRGYEIGPERYVLITDEELESLSPERSRSVEIVEFIDIKEVDPIFYDHPYYFLPSKGGEKAYRLLVEVMRRTNKAGIAKLVLHDRDTLVAIKSTGEALSLITLHYHRDILPDKGITPKESPVEAGEKDLLKKNIKKMMTDFDPEKYADDRRKKLVALLTKKVKEKAMVEAPIVPEEEGEGPADLVAALQEIMHKMKEKR